MLKRIFKQQINSITIAAALVALSSLVSRFLGVVRDRILAGQFGADKTLDIYYAAFRIPDLIFNLIVLGALSAGFIPIFTSLIKDFSCNRQAGSDAAENKTAWDLANNVLNYLFLGLAILSTIGIIFAPQLTRLITPGFSSEEQAATAALTRLMCLSPVFLGISGILGGAIQLPTVYHLGFRFRLGIRRHDEKTKQIGKMMVPRTLSLAISQINLVIVTVIASTLPSGSLAVFNFANNLQSFPIGIFGISFAIAAFPSLAAVAFDKEKLTANFSQTFRQILFFVIPATVLIIALRAQIIRVVLGSGKFDWADTVATMNTLGFFSLSLFAQATIPLMVRVFYARHNSTIPFRIGLVTVAVNTILAFILAPRMGVTGLAFAYSIDNILNFILLWLWMYFTIGNFDIGNIFKSVLKLMASALLAGMAAQLMKVVVWPFIDV